MSDLLKTLTAKKPSCFKDFELVHTDDRSTSVMPFKPEFVHVMLHCPCGSEYFYVSAHKYEDTINLFFFKKTRVLFLGPVYLECAGCGKESLSFDPFRHGWNSEGDHLTGYKPRGLDDELELTRCYDKPGKVAVCYSYQGILNYEDLIEEGIQNPQDFFDTFELTFCIKGTTKYLNITSDECR